MATHADAGCKALADVRPDDYPYLAVVRWCPATSVVDRATGAPYPAIMIEIRHEDTAWRKSTVSGPLATVLGAALFDGNQPVRYHWVRVEGSTLCVGPTAPFQGWRLEPWSP